jgi:hypothetical protein
MLKTLQNPKLLPLICSALLSQNTGTKQKQNTGVFKISTPYGPKHKWKNSEHTLSQHHIKWNSSSRSERAYINTLQIKDFNIGFLRFVT